MPFVCGGGLELAETLWIGGTRVPDGKPDGRTLPEGRGAGAAEPDAKAVGKPDAIPEGPTPPEGRAPPTPTPEPEGIPAGIPEGTPEATPEGDTPIAEPEGTSVAKAAALDVEAASVTPVMPPVAATERTLEEMASAAVTGQIVVLSSTVSVTRTVDTFSGAVEARSLREAELAGQLVTEAAQLRTVRTEVVSTVRVVSSAAALVVLLSWGIAEADPAADPAADPEADTGKIVDVTVSSGSQVSSSSSWVEFVFGFAMAAPRTLPEKSRREAYAPADWKRILAGFLR